MEDESYEVKPKSKSVNTFEHVLKRKRKNSEKSFIEKHIEIMEIKKEVKFRQEMIDKEI